MFRTREWVMFVAGCVFVLGAIMVTLWSDVSLSTAPVRSAVSFVTERAIPEQQTAVVAAAPERGSAVFERMREKVAQYRATHNTDTDQFTVATTVPQDDVSDDAETSLPTETLSAQYCDPENTAYVQPWPRNVVVEEREGVRVVYVAGGGVATGTVGLPDDLLLRLPAPGRPGIEQRCLPGEVVGVAQDGSLIRNDEVGLYQIFSADTVVGYALDGFPIYGKNDSIIADACGGGMGPEGYGYVLQSERDTVLQCFRGRPAQL